MWATASPRRRPPWSPFHKTPVFFHNQNLAGAMNNMRVPILLSPKQLLRLKNKPGILLVDTRPFPDYQKEHLPLAVNLPLLYYHWTDTSPEGIKAFNYHMQRVLAF